MAERLVRTLNKFVHACQAERSDWKVELQNFLCQYRATPHTSTKISPYEALTGRQMRTALPELIATHKKPLRDLKANDDTAKLLQKKYADTPLNTICRSVTLSWSVSKNKTNCQHHTTQHVLLWKR